MARYLAETECKTYTHVLVVYRLLYVCFAVFIAATCGLCFVRLLLDVFMVQDGKSGEFAKKIQGQISRLRGIRRHENDLIMENNKTRVCYCTYQSRGRMKFKRYTHAVHFGVKQ